MFAMCIEIIQYITNWESYQVVKWNDNEKQLACI